MLRKGAGCITKKHEEKGGGFADVFILIAVIVMVSWVYMHALMNCTCYICTVYSMSLISQ